MKEKNNDMIKNHNNQDMKKVNALTYLKNATGALANIVLTFVLLCTLATGQAWGAGKILYDLKTSVGTAEVTAANATVTEGVSLVLSNTAGRIKLSPKAGEKFKNGDKIVFSGTIGNTSLKYGIKIFAANGTTNAGEIYVAGTTSPLACEGRLSLSADADFIYIARYDGTTTTMTDLTITRDTEYTLNANGSTSNSPNTGTSYTIPGTFVAGGGAVSLTVGSQSNNGVKLRTSGRTPSISENGIGGNYYAIEVNPGYKITGIDFQFANNYANTSTITGIYVDGDYNTNKLSAPLTSGTNKAAVNGSVSGIEATERIVFAVTTGSEVSGNQQNFLAKITYEEIPAVVQEIESLTINGLAISSANLTTLKSSKTVTINDVYTSVPALAVSTTDHLEPVVGAPAVDGKQYTYTFSYNDEDYTVVLSNVNLPDNEATLLYTIAKDAGGTLDKENLTWTSADGKLVVDYSKKSSNFDDAAQLNGYKFYNTQLDFTAPAGYAIDYIQITGYTNNAGSEIPLTVTGSGIVSPTYSKYKGTSTQSNIDVINYIDETPTAGEQYSVYFGTPQSNGSKVLIYGHEVQEPEPVPVTWKDIKMDFTGEGSFIRQVTTAQWGAINTGIAVAEDGTVSTVATGADDSKATLTGKYHGTDNGVSGAKLVVPVAGSVKISIGRNNNGTKAWVVKDGADQKVADISSAGTMYTTANGSVAVAYYDGPATTLTINGEGTYTGYIAVEEIDPALIPCYVSFANSDGAVEGTLPASTNVTKGSQFTAPVNNLLYKEGYTLTAWEDASGNKYTPGQNITVTKDITLTPVFTQNTDNLADRTTGVTLNWDFQTNQGAPLVGYDGNTGFLVTQGTVNGKAIDVKLAIDATSGKFNTSNGDWAQVNNGTKFTIPSATGAVVSMYIMTDPGQTTTVDEQPYDSFTSNTATWTVAGSNTSVVADINGGTWYKWLQVILPPARVATPVISDANGNVTITCATDGAAIYYTTDGSEPTNASTLYNNTFTLQDDATVKAIAIKDGLTNSKVASKYVTGSSSVTHTWDFTKWSEATKTQILGASDWTKSENASKTYITGDEIRWNAEVNCDAEGNLMANGTVIKELEGLRHNDLSAYGLGIAFNYQTTTDANNWGPYNSPSYLWVTGASSSIKVPYVKAGSTFKVASESHNPSDARGFTVKVNGNVVESSTGSSTSKTLTEFTYTIPDDAKGYVDVVLTATKGCHLYYIDAETVEPPMEWRDIKMDLRNAAFLSDDEKTNATLVTYGVAVDESGTVTRVASDASNSRATVTGKFQSNDHGYQDFSITVPVQGPVKVTVGACGWGGIGTIKIDEETIATFSNKISEGGDCYHNNTEANKVSALYERETPATLTISGFGYVPYIAIESYTPFGPSAGGYYNVRTTEELLRALDEASRTATSEETRVKIFLKKGTYDLGTKTLTNVTSYVSLIGEDREGTIICNQPTVEGIGVTATLKPTGSHIYMQDLSLRCTVGYDSQVDAGRGVALQDVGNYNVYKNVGLLSDQDTYYSNGGDSQKSYFENCYITGTVDYICGGGDIWFEKTTLYNNARSSADVIVAPATAAYPATQWGYVFNNCIVDGDAGQAGKYNLGRDWKNSPACTFLNTIFKILPTAAAYGKMSETPLVLRFHEYNNKDSRGNLVTGHNLNSMLGGSEYTSQLYLTEQQAAQYTLANVFGSWNPASLTAQASTEGTVQDGSVLTFPAEGTYLIEKDGNYVTIVTGTSYTMPDDGRYTVRRANEMGGFGPKSDVYTTRQGEIAWSDFKMELMTEGILTSDYSYWVSDGKGGLTKTGASESHYLVKMKGEYHNNHGYTNLVVRFKAPGSVKIGVGGCSYSKNNTIINTLADIDAATGTKYGEINANESCFHNDSKYYNLDYTGDEAFIEIKGAVYVPAISVKSTGDIPVAEGKWIRYKNQDFENAEKIDDNWTSAADDRYFSSQNVRSGDSHYVLYNAGTNNGTTFTYNGIPAVGTKYTDAEIYKVEFDAGLVPVNTSGSAQTQSFKILDLSGNELCNWTLTVPANSSPKDTDGDIMIGGESVAKFTATRPTPTFYHIEIVGGTPAGTTMKVTDVNGKVNTYTLSKSSVKIGNLTYATGKSNGGLALDNLKVLVYNDIPEYKVDLPETVEAKTGFRTKLTAEAEGAVGYQWYKNTEASLSGGEPIEGATDMTYSFTPTEEGTEYYYVKAWNKFGTTASHLATVNITKAIPEITKLEFGSFDFSKKKFKVKVEGIGDIHLKFDDAAEYVDYDEEDQSNVYALNSVTAYATTRDGQSMPVTLTQPIQYDPEKPFAAWIYTKSYVNSTTKAELDHEAQDQPITNKIREICNLINVEFPNEDDVYGKTHPSLNRADLIVFSEMVVGGKTLPNSMESLIGNVPFLNFKAFNYGVSTHRWEWGNPGQEDDYTATTVIASNPWLKMFDGVKIVDNSAEPTAASFGTPVFEVCDKSNGAWNDAIKHLQWIDRTSLSSTLPTVKAATTFTTYAKVGDNKIFMHGFNPVAGSESVDALAPYILFALNFDNAQAVSEDAITIAGNLARMMLNNESFDTPSAGLAPEITDNGDGSAHITSNIYKGNIYYKVVEENAAAPAFDAGTWSQVDAEGNTAKQVAGNWKVYSVVKFPTSLTGTPDGVTIPTGESDMGNGTLVGTNIRIVHFRAGTSDETTVDPVTRMELKAIPSEFSVLSKGDEAEIRSDYKIPMNVSIVKAEPGKENEPVRPYYTFSGWAADQNVKALLRTERPQDFDPYNPPSPIPYPDAAKVPGTLLPTTTFVQMPEHDLTFETRFRRNMGSLQSAEIPTLVTWDFTRNGELYDRTPNGEGGYNDGTFTPSHLGADVWGAQEYTLENEAQYYNRLSRVKDLNNGNESQLTETQKYIDVPLFLDARNVTGANNQVFQVSFNNTESATSVKTKDGMIFGIPAVYGMQIKLLGTDGTTFGGANSKSTVGGELINAVQHKLLQNVTGAGTETVTMTYMGKKDYLYVELYEGNANADIFMKGISVIYPARVNITPQVKVGDAVNNEAGKIIYKPVDEEIQLSETTPFTKNVVDTLTAKAAYGYKFVGWYDNAGTEITTGIISTEVDGNDNVIASTLGYTPTATGNITAKFQAIGKVKMQVTTYRNTPADTKTPNLELNSRVVANDKGEFATFEFSTTQLGETVVFEPTYNDSEKCYEIEVTPGTVVTAHGVQIPGNRFKKWSKWTYANETWTETPGSVVTENPHTFTVAETTKYYVQYEDVSGGYMVTYQNGGETITVPLQQNSMYEYAAPKYHTAYKEGYSLLGWQNNNKYFIYNNESEESNAVIAGQAGAITLEGKATVSMGDDYILTPIYAQNNALSKLAGRKAAVTVTWDFTQAQRAQVLNFGTNATGKYVARAVVQANDNKFYSCDVPMTYDTGKRGRINNTSSAAWCTMGQGTTLTVPACKGATITFVTRSAISAADGGTRINGAVPTLESESANGKVYTYTVSEDVETIDVVLGKDYSYYKSLSVTLPPVRQHHEVALIASDLTDLSSKYSFDSSKKTFIATGTGEEITLKAINGTFNIYPTSSMSSSSQYVAGEKGYFHCPKDGQGFTVKGMKNITRICFRQGARINTGNAWKVVANPGGKNANGDPANEVVLLADHKSTVPEWIEINDIYLDNDPVIAFYNLSYQENKVDKSTTAGPYDIYLFNLEMYGIAETTDAQMTLEVGGKLENNGELTNGGGTVWVDPYTMCLPTEAEQTQFHNSNARPVSGLEHYATPRRTMQFDEGTEVVMTAEPDFGFEFQSWIGEDGKVISTKNPYTFKIHKNEKIYAKYQSIGHIIYTFGGVNYEGSVPGEQQTERGQFKVPANLTLYKNDNSTLAYWINPDDPTAEKREQGVTQEHYEVTKTYAYSDANDHFTGYDVYLSPVFMDNSFSLLDVEEPATVRWPFGQKSGAPEFNIEQRTGFEMGQVKKSGSSSEFIDVRMSISAVKQPNGGVGKVNNVGRSDDYAQVNQNTVFTFPMTKGMKLVVASDNSISKSKFGGAVPTTAGKTATFYSVKKGDGTHKIGGNEIDDVQLYINDGSQNFRYIEATYYPRLKQPVFTTTSAPTSSARVNVTAPATSGATNEKIYYTFTKDGSMPADPTISSTLVNNGYIEKGFENGKPIIIKAINIADNRPDSKITTYVVLPYDADKNTAVYFFNSEDKDYDMGADPVFLNLVKESVGNFNLIPYNIRAGVPGEGDMKTHITNEKVKAYIAADKDKNNTVVTGVNTASKPVVSLNNVLDNIVDWNAAGTEFTLKNTNNDNLAIFDKVLIAYNETTEKNDAVCVSNTGSLTHSGVNYNAAYIIGNATKALIGGAASSTWASTATKEPQVRKQMFAGRYVSAAALGLLSGGETTYPVDVWSDAIQVAATAEEGTGYIGCEQPSAGNMKAVVNLYRDEQKTNLLRSYTINLQMVSNTDNLVFTDKDNDTETYTWNNGTWSIKKADGFVSGNDGECFKFNNPVDLTITGPANYGIKSITFHGYDYVGGAAGGAQTSPMAATTTAGSMSSGVEASSIKMYNNNEYQSHVDGDLKINFPLTSTNTTTIHLEGAHQWIGSIKIEYFERMTSAINITKAELGETKTEPKLTLPSNGRVAISFNSVMAEVTKSQANKVTIRGGKLAEDMALSADGNISTLMFSYWNLEAGEYTLTVPFAALKDIYGTPYTGSASEWDSYKVADNRFEIPFTVDAKNYTRKKFDFIVNDRDHKFNWDGSHIVGLNTLGGNDDDERKYMLFLNSKDEYFIATGEQANKDNKTSTIFTDVDNNGIMNGRTRLTAKNLSLIGESQRNETNAKGVLITSLPKEEGSSSTPTIEFKLKACTDNYIQDLTIRNSWPYNATNFAGRATAMLDNGTNTIMKNVRLESWQDTYYTQGVRGYNEDCTFMGVVDFIYGHGDYWFKNCNIVLRDRIGNNIVAANTSAAEKWGYVFDHCTIDKEYGASLVSSGSFTLGRPWQGSPAATFLNTTMKLTPTKQGWTQMSEGLVVRYHEYGSMDEEGNTLNISTRSIAGLSPAKGSDSPVLTEAEAAKYNIHDVLGGDNGFDPTEHTRQIPTIDNLYVDGQGIYWKDRQEALCYFIYYLGDGAEPNTDDPILVANIAPEYSKEAGFNLFKDDHVFRGEQTFADWYIAQTSNDEFTHGWFAVRAANQRGGLNAMSNIVEYHKVREYKARVTNGGKESGDDSGYVWSTIYLDFNAKVPEGVYAYALTDVTAFGGQDVTETTIHLKRVSDEVAQGHQDIIYKNMGYILYGPGPEYKTDPTSEYQFIETGHMNVIGDEEESRTDFMKSYLSGTIGNFKGTVSKVSGVVGETGERGWSSYYLDYTDVPVGYTTAYTLSTKTVEGTSFGLGFYKYQGSTFGHHKAFLDTDEVSRLLATHDVDPATIQQALSKGFNVVFRDANDELTRIVHVENNEITEVSGTTYDITGRKINPASMRKGEVYIINGRKIRF